MVNFDRILSGLKEVTATHASSSDDSGADEPDAASAKDKGPKVSQINVFPGHHKFDTSITCPTFISYQVSGKGKRKGAEKKKKQMKGKAEVPSSSSNSSSSSDSSDEEETISKQRKTKLATHVGRYVLYSHETDLLPGFYDVEV